MSEGLPPGATSLEPGDETELVGAVTDPAVTERGETEQEPEGVITSPSGEKMVPLKALTDTRGRLKEQLKAKDAELAREKPLADKYREVEPQVRAAMPIIEGIQRRPDLVAQLNQPAPVPKEAMGPLTADEAVEYAKDFDLYKADGTPDVDRAQRIAKRHEVMNQRTTAAAVAPFAQNEAQRQSYANLQTVANWKDAQGNTVDPAILRQVWNNIPPEMSAKPEVAGVLYRMALAEQILQGGGPRAPMAPALTTEGAGGRPLQPAAVTNIDRDIMKAAGITEKDYTNTASRFKPGQSNLLE